MSKLSVIIPVYNVEKYLMQCLDSVISQTWHDLEIICVDDGSTDASLEILKKYAKNDSRIIILQQTNGGAGKARNEALKISTGQYVHFLDADDWLNSENAYEKMIDVLEKNRDCSFVMFGYQKYDNEKKTFSNFELPVGVGKTKIAAFSDDYAMMLKLPVVPWNKLYRRTFLQKHNIMFDELICANDRTFYFKSIFHATKVLLVKDCLMNYRVNNQASLVGSARINHFNCHIDAYKNTKIALGEQSREIEEILIDLTMNDFLYFYNRVQFPENQKVFYALQKFFSEWEEIQRMSTAKYSWNSQYKIIANSIEKTVKQKTVPIVLATNENYASYLVVTLESIKALKTEEWFYDIYVLYDIMSPQYIDMIEQESCGNMRVQCINVSAMIDAAILYEKGHFSREMYFRFLIPELLPHYEKVVYLDCDLIIKRDISELYINDIGNNIMGVVTNITNNEMYNYAKNVLKIIPERYFNSGVLLINTTQFKKEYVKERCLELLAKMPKLACPDQDVLNMVCYEKVQYLDSKWNFQWHHQWDKSGGALAEYFQEQFDNSWENPYIVHYTSSEKPWKRPDKPLAKQWWAYARKTQCYEEILYRNLNKELYMTEKTETKTSIFMKIPGAIQCYKEHGLKYTAKRVIVHLKRIVK